MTLVVAIEYAHEITLDCIPIEISTPLFQNYTYILLHDAFTIDKRVFCRIMWQGIIDKFDNILMNKLFRTKIIIVALIRYSIIINLNLLYVVNCIVYFRKYYFQAVIRNRMGFYVEAIAAAKLQQHGILITAVILTSIYYPFIAFEAKFLIYLR